MKHDVVSIVLFCEGVDSNGNIIFYYFSGFQLCSRRGQKRA